MIRLFKAASAYFAIVFAVGFILGVIRVLLVAPYLGERDAELIELPFMLTAIVLASRWTVNRFKLEIWSAIISGCIAAGLLLVVEFSVVLWLRGLSIREFLASRDPVAATAYYAAVSLFAIMPGSLAYLYRRRDE
ncbi:MAG TPA: hypothetical protein VFZ49_05345 [Pyrinomonadaceae bacterium]